MEKIPFAAQIPSLVSLRARVRAERPSASQEYVDAVAVLVQCVYEDYYDWATTESTAAQPLNPAEFTTLVQLAGAYLLDQD